MKRGRDRCQENAVAGVGDRWGVVHHAVNRVADALIIEGRHGKGLDAPKEPGSVVMIESLGEAHGPAKIKETKQTTREAETRVGLVLGSTRGVVAAGQIAFRGLALASRGPERTDDQEQGHLESNHDKEQFVGRVSRQGIHQGGDQVGIGANRVMDGVPLDDIVDNDLHRPGQHQHGEQAQEHQPHLDRKTTPKRADEAQGPPDHPKGLPVAEFLALLHGARATHRAAASAASRSVFTRAR